METRIANKFVENKDTKAIYIFTDGSSYPNNARSTNSKGGCAFLALQCTDRVLDDEFEVNIANTEKLLKNKSNIYGAHYEVTDTLPAPTNIRMEGIAIYKALCHIAPVTTANIIVVTDSMFWMDMLLKYMPNWDKNNVNFNTRKNPDITRVLFDIYKKYESRITFEHIRSHMDITENDTGCDKIYNIANRLADEYAYEFRVIKTPVAELYEVIIE